MLVACTPPGLLNTHAPLLDTRQQVDVFDNLLYAVEVVAQAL